MSESMGAGGIGGIGGIAVKGDDGIAQLTAAVERSARLRLLQAQIPGQIETADAAVAAAYERLGISMPSAPKGKRGAKATGPKAPRVPTGPYVPEPGSKAETLWDLLPATVEGLAEITGLSRVAVGTTLGSLGRFGHARRDDSTDPPLWHRAGPPDAPQTSPAFASNGAAAE